MLKNVILEGSFTLPAYLSPDCGLLIKSILKRKPDSRLSLEDVARHPWLGGEVSWEGEEAAGYRPHPRLGASLSPVESEVMERLEQLGISVDTLRQETIRGVRSPVIATYRWEGLVRLELIATFLGFCFTKLSRISEKLALSRRL